MKIIVTLREENTVKAIYKNITISVDLQDYWPALEVEQELISNFPQEEMKLVGKGKYGEKIWIPKKENYSNCIFVYPFEYEKSLAMTSESELEVVGSTPDEAVLNLAKLMGINDPVRLGKFNQTLLYFV